MKLTEQNQYYRFDTCFDAGVVAGFSKPSVFGAMPQDFFTTVDVGAPCDVAYMKQIHGATVHVVENPGVYEGDALFTSKVGLGLVVRTADCLPIVLRSAKQGVVGVVHMGWKPAEAGIIENIPFDLTDFTAVAGVGMRKCCYQVGPEFLAYKRLGAYVTKTPKGLNLDPIAFAKAQLTKKGLRLENFFDCGVCSVCDTRRFPSWRIDKNDIRTLTFIFKK